MAALSAVLADAGAAWAARRAPLEWRWSGVPRLLVIADVHGAYESLVELLQEARLVSPALEWIGGDAHLVMLGDLVDRGPRSRDVLDLIMRLQRAAPLSGGKVHVLLGNHEVMNLIGDLRYVSAEDYPAFRDDEDPAEREAALRRLAKRKRWQGREEELETAFPPGFFARRRAFSPQGVYGRWLLEQRVLIVIDDLALVHGGLPPTLLRVAPDEINEVALRELRDLLEAQEELTEALLLEPDMSYGDQQELLEILVRRLSAFDTPVLVHSARVAATVQQLLVRGLVFRDDGPLLYRGTSLNSDCQEQNLTAKVLEHLGARTVVVGHTPNHTGRMTTRLAGKVVLADTGMLTSHYEGRASALVRQDGRLRVLYRGEGVATLSGAPAGIAGAAAMADAEVEELLRTATVVEKQDVGSGSTRPQILTLARDGERYRAIFKTVEVHTGGGGDQLLVDDSYRHEVAAYRIDRLLGLGMVPPTVIRRIDGESGSVQLWVEDALSELSRRSEDLVPKDMAAYRRQLGLATVFDVLIQNAERDLTNMLVTKCDWKVHLIDHSRAFGISAQRPAILEETQLRPEGTQAPSEDQLGERLQTLDGAVIRESLGGLLSDVQIEALLERRDRILEEHRVLASAQRREPIPETTPGAALQAGGDR